MTTAQPNDPTTAVGDMLASASPDLLRSMLSTFIQTLMGAEAGDLGNRTGVLPVSLPLNPDAPPVIVVPCS